MTCDYVMQISVLGIVVRKRKYAGTPLRRSLCFRRYAGTQIAVFTPIPCYANRCVYGAFAESYSQP